MFPKECTYLISISKNMTISETEPTYPLLCQNVIILYSRGRNIVSVSDITWIAKRV